MLKPNEMAEGGSGTTVGANVVLTGTIKDVNDIIVHGKVEGEVISERSVFIGDNAMIKGPVSAQIITISGKVKGAVTGNDKIELTPSAKVYGSITTKDLVIQSGAVFVGKSMMPDHESENKDMEESDSDKKSDKKDKENEKEEKEDNTEQKEENDSPTYEVE